MIGINDWPGHRGYQEIVDISLGGACIVHANPRPNIQVSTMKHPRTWFVVTDGGRARILQKRQEPNAFDVQSEFVSAAVHSHTHELGAERPGRSHESANSSHHAVEPREDLHQTEKRKFVDEVARSLNDANAKDSFDRLVLVAPARALGELKEALDAATQQKVVAQLQKDLTHVPSAELSEHFVGLGILPG